MQNDIVIVDYGMANLRSVQKAFEKVGHAAGSAATPTGVGRGRQAGAARRRGLPRRHRPAARGRPGRADHARTSDSGKPFLGICLGLQLLFTTSYEDGEYAGLDVFPGEVVRFPDVPGLKVPHMGWNQLRMRRPAPLLEDLPPEPAVYFVHSYYVVPRRPLTDRHRDRLSDAVHLVDLARQRLRHAVPSGEKPARRPGHAAEVRRAVRRAAGKGFPTVAVTLQSGGNKSNRPTCRGRPKFAAPMAADG